MYVCGTYAMRHTCRSHWVWQPSSQFYLSVFFSKVHYVAQAGLTLQIFLFSCPNTRVTGTWHTRFSTFFLTVILRYVWFGGFYTPTAMPAPWPPCNRVNTLGSSCVLVCKASHGGTSRGLQFPHPNKEAGKKSDWHQFPFQNRLLYLKVDWIYSNFIQQPDFIAMRWELLW